MRKGLIFACITCLSACSMTPTYVRPVVDMPASFKEASAMWQVVTEPEHFTSEDFWQSFQDPYLIELVQKVDAQNLQIAAALARYDSAVAYLNLSEAGLSPQVSAAGSTNRNQQSIDRPLRSATQPNLYPSTTLGVQASYEIDFWGRIRSQVKSASNLAEATRHDIENVKLLLEAEVVNRYFDLRSYDSQLAIVQNNLLLYQKQVNIIQKRYQQGTVAGNDVYRVKELFENEHIKEKALQTKRAQLEHAIALLIAEPASNFSIPKGNIDAITIPKMAIDLSSRLLLRRPDIRSAEKRVEAANELIGVAKAAYYPNFSLSGIFGFQNAGNDALISTPTQFWSIGPNLFFMLFDGGTRDAGLKQALAKNQESTAIYKNTVLTAIREIEDILVDTKNREESLVNINHSVTYSNKSYLIALSRYNNGIATYLEVVDAALQKSQSELALCEYKAQLLNDHVLLLKGLGGYWQEGY